MELITVYIPTFNRPQLLQRAVDSVLTQTYSNIEIIIINDGDNNEYIDALSKFKNIVVINNENNLGACACRNLAIVLAKGVYITGLDDDDEFHPQHLSNLLKAYDPKYSCVATTFIERRKKYSVSHCYGVGEISYDDLLHYNLVGNQVFTETSKLKIINGFDDTLGALQDYDTWLRLLQEFGPCLKVDNKTYTWNTDHELPRITSNSEKRLNSLLSIYEKHSYNKEQKNSFDFLKRRISGDDVSLFYLLKVSNSVNIKFVIKYYLSVKCKSILHFSRLILKTIR